MKKNLSDRGCEFRTKSKDQMKFFLKYKKRYRMSTLDREKVCVIIIDYEGGEMIVNNLYLVIRE